MVYNIHDLKLLASNLIEFFHDKKWLNWTTSAATLKKKKKLYNLLILNARYGKRFLSVKNNTL